MPTTWFRRCLPVLPLMLALGCGDSPKPLVPVSGKVSYRGMPLQNGTIVFTPDPRKGSSGDMAFSDIKPDGTYSLRTGKGLGAAPGHYRITVASVFGTPQYSYQPASLPDKYRDPEQSGLFYEVKSGTAQAVDLNLD